MNTENRDQKEDQVGSSTALSNHQEEQQDDHQSWDLNQQSKDREPRTQRQHMAAPRLDTEGEPKLVLNRSYLRTGKNGFCHS